MKLEKVEKILALANGDKEVTESAVVRLADPLVTMFGKQFNDLVTNHPRASMQVHPYRWYAAGAAGVVAYQDDHKDIQVVFITKQGKPKDKWYLPGGYGTAGPLKDGHGGLGIFTSEQIDEAEVGILTGQADSYQSVLEKYQININTQSWAPPVVDINLEDCIIRELSEEIGLTNVKNKKPELVLHEGVYLDYPLSVLDNTYLIDYGSEKPVLIPDKKEVSNAFWIAIRDITVKKTADKRWQFMYNNITIDPNIANQVSLAIKKLRDKDFILKSKEAVINLFKKLDLSCYLPIATHPWEFGDVAYANHLRLVFLEAQILNKAICCLEKEKVRYVTK